MSPVDALPPAQRAALQLLLQQGRSYAEIGELLKISPEAVRDRAHAGLAALGPDAGRLAAGRRGELSDYLLGQQDGPERDDTRAFLAGSAAGRAWARAVSGELRPLARDPLPEIPDGSRDAERRGARGAAGTVAAVAQDDGEAAEVADRERAARRGRRSRARRDGAADAGAGAVAADPVEDEGDEPAPSGRAREPLRDGGGGSAPRSSRLGGALLLAGVAVAVIVVIVLLVSSGGDDEEEPTASTPRSQTQPTQTGPPATPVAQVNLKATEAGGRAVGVAQVLRQGGQTALAIVAQRLQPNSRGNAYAVWLYSTPKRSQLLGYVNPPVGRNGQFSNFQALPKEANRYRDVIVTRETRQSQQPGEIILQGPLKLRGK